MGIGPLAQAGPRGAADRHHLMWPLRAASGGRIGLCMMRKARPTFSGGTVRRGRTRSDPSNRYVIVGRVTAAPIYRPSRNQARPRCRCNG